jgi:hypothetical protein
MPAWFVKVTVTVGIGDLHLIGLLIALRHDN